MPALRRAAAGASQVEQGLGLGAFFNRAVATSTRFIKLRGVKFGSTGPPPVLVLHARCGPLVMSPRPHAGPRGCAYVLTLSSMLWQNQIAYF